MITALQVQNFKSIKSLDLAMRPFMVLVGPNGAGKTNVVQALDLLGDLLQRGTTDPAREIGWGQIIRREQKPARGGLVLAARVPIPPQLISLTISAPEREIDPQSLEGIYVDAKVALRGSVGDGEISVDREELTLRRDKSVLKVVANSSGGVTVSPGNDPVLWAMAAPMRPRGRQAEMPIQQELIEYYSERWVGADAETRNVLKVLNPQRFYFPWMSYLATTTSVTRVRLDASALRTDAAFKDVSSGNLLGSSGEGLAVVVDRLRQGGKDTKAAWDRVLIALREVYPRIEDVRAHPIQPGRLTLMFRERGISEELGLANVSDGVLHALALLVMLEVPALPAARRAFVSPSGGVLAIEEPENAIHPWSVIAMMQRAQQDSRRQTIITTHSPTVVDAVVEPSSLFVTEHHGDGTTVEPALSREAALGSILAESGQRLGDVWLGGSIGGVPHDDDA